MPHPASGFTPKTIRPEQTMTTQTFRGLFNDAAGNLRAKVAGIYGILLVFNVAAWVWAILAFRQYPLLLGNRVSCL